MSSIQKRRGKKIENVQQEKCSFMRTILPAMLILCGYLSYLNMKALKRLSDNSSNAASKGGTSLDLLSEVSPGHALNATFRHKYCEVIQRVEQVKFCYPPEMMRQLEDPSCQTIQTWNDVQRCLTGRFNPSSPPPAAAAAEEGYEIHVIGERNSGTKFITEELQKCFPRLSSSSSSTTGVGVGTTAGRLLPVIHAHRDFIRSKHFFQNAKPNASFRRSIVVSIFRDPVEWAASMREHPYHAPAHVAGFDPITDDVIPLKWHDFVTKTWAMKRSEYDLQMIRQKRIPETENTETTPCVEHFALHQVVPCVYENNGTNSNRSLHIPEQKLRGYWPVYELRRDQTGRPFHDVLELRREKIINHLLEVPLLFPSLAGYAAVRYEDLLVFGTRALLEQVALIIGLPSLPVNCAPALPQIERIGRRVIPDDFRDYVKSHVDVETERLLGYVS